MGLEYPHDSMSEGWNSERFRTHIHIFKSKVKDLKVDFNVERSKKEKKKHWNLTRDE